MELRSRDWVREEMNRLAGDGEPFLFMLDFKGDRGVVCDLKSLRNSDIACSVGGVDIGREVSRLSDADELNVTPIGLDVYKASFERVISHIKHGDSYLLNLTFATEIGRDLNLEAIYCRAKAPYKLLFRDKFLFYSPEPFVRIKDGRIYSFPMKGTIDANLSDAEKVLLDDQKELYEHYTIVDLIRNDLSMVASGVVVDKFRYVERINSAKGAILQTSSQISGNLADGWQSELGDIILKLLPAGSVSGAPKEMTVDIIDRCELSQRGFYTGVMGVFDGETVDSCVIIRYIESGDDGRFYYRSGGGITSRSVAEDEYNELISKIYVPIV